MTRNHRVPGVVRVICTDSYHEGKLVHLFTFRQATRQAGEPALLWRGKIQPVKQWAAADGVWTFRLTCRGGKEEGDGPCGRDPQRREPALAGIADMLFAANPGATRVDLDIAKHL